MDAFIQNPAPKGIRHLHLNDFLLMTSDELTA